MTQPERIMDKIRYLKVSNPDTQRRLDQLARGIADFAAEVKEFADDVDALRESARGSPEAS